MKRARPYHKRWHGNALNGMRGLTLEERGAYNTLLDLMYDRQGPIADDERRICGELDCDIRVWRRVRESLAEKGKIYLRDGLIGNERVDRELGTSAELPGEVREKFAGATQELSAKSEEKPKENNEGRAQKNRKSDLLIQSPESIPPIAPKGATEPAISKDQVEAIWVLASDVSRKRSGREPLRQQLVLAAKRGHSFEDVHLGLQGFFASDDALRDGGKFVPGVHRLVKDGRWEAHLPARPVAAAPMASDADLFATSAERSDEAGKVDPVWAARVREFIRNAYWNTLDWGPKPGRDGCRVPQDALDAAGFPPNLIPLAGRRGAA